MIQIVGGNIKVTNDVPEMLSAAGSVSLSSINFAIWSHLHPEVPDYTGYLALFSINTTLAVGPGFKSRLVTYPRQPVGPNTETLHEALEGRELIELDFKSASHLEVAGLRATDRSNDGSFYTFEAPGLARARAHLGARAHVRGQVRAPCGRRRAPLRQVPPIATRAAPRHNLAIPVQAPDIGVVLLMLALPTHPPESGVLPHDAVLRGRRAAFRRSCRETRHVRDAQGVRHGPDVLVILTHDACLLDVLEFFHKADLAGWEMNPSRKDIGRWRFLNDFRKVC